VDVDLLEGAAAGELMERVRPSRLLHLAWYAVPGEYWTSGENLRWLEASLRLVRAFAAVRGERATLAGTCAEYEWSRSRYREDEAPLRPATLYGASKLALGQVAETYASAEGFSLAVGRIFFTYGPGEPEGRLLPSIVRPLLEGRRAATTDGSPVRDFLHAADVADALVALLHSDVTGPVNIASGEGVAVRELVALAAEAAGRPELVDYGALPPRPDEPAELVADVRRLREVVGWRPSLPLAEGVARTVDELRARLLSRTTGY